MSVSAISGYRLCESTTCRRLTRSGRSGFRASARPRSVSLASLLITASILATPARADVSPEGEFLTLTNVARARVGAPPLVLDRELDSVAQGWAGRMTTFGRLVHNPNLASECQNWQRLAENI